MRVIDFDFEANKKSYIMFSTWAYQFFTTLVLICEQAKQKQKIKNTPYILLKLYIVQLLWVPITQTGNRFKIDLFFLIVLFKFFVEDG